MLKPTQPEKTYRFGIGDFLVNDAQPDEHDGYAVHFVRDRLDDNAPSTIEEHFNDTFTLLLEGLGRFKKLSHPVSNEEGSDLLALLSGLISAQKTLRTAQGAKSERLIAEHEKRIERIREDTKEKPLE